MLSGVIAKNIGDVFFETHSSLQHYWATTNFSYFSCSVVVWQLAHYPQVTDFVVYPPTAWRPMRGRFTSDCALVGAWYPFAFKAIDCSSEQRLAISLHKNAGEHKGKARIQGCFGCWNTPERKFFKIVTENPEKTHLLQFNSNRTTLAATRWVLWAVNVPKRHW